MDIVVTDLENVYLIKINDKRLDKILAVDLKKKLQKLIEGNPNSIILDLTSVEFIDSSGLGVIVNARKLIGRENELVLVGVNPAVIKMLKMTRLINVFKIMDSQEEAIEYLKK